jgi:RNA-directed DNA polymerase
MEPPEGKMPEIPGLENISTKRRRIARLAMEAPDRPLVSLNHCIDLEWMREAYRRTRKNAAPGVDGQKAEEYAGNLDENLRSLLDRAKSGAYRAPPVRRVYIPKGQGSEKRPIGIPTFEDKVLQRAVVMVLEAIYEQDFLPCSYGFRPRRSAHQALETFWRQAMAWYGGWVVEVDIRRYFDTVDHGHLRQILRQRVRDGVLLGLIGKWLNAGVLEEGRLGYPEVGTPQGGVVSPMLANIYLHEVLDGWFEARVKPRLKGRAFLIRFADDTVLCFEREDDARRVLAALPKRFGKYGLALHPDKTRLVPFQTPARRRRKAAVDGGCQPGSFEFLGFTHYWGKSQKGNWVIKRKTSPGRFGRALRRVSAWCASVRHRPLREQHADLVRKLRGHYAYYGITGNTDALSRFSYETLRVWMKWLRRRGQQRCSWDAAYRPVERFPLPESVAIHSILRSVVKP